MPNPPPNKAPSKIPFHRPRQHRKKKEKFSREFSQSSSRTCAKLLRFPGANFHRSYEERPKECPSASFLEGEVRKAPSLLSMHFLKLPRALESSQGSRSTLLLAH